MTQLLNKDHLRDGGKASHAHTCRTLILVAGLLLGHSFDGLAHAAQPDSTQFAYTSQPDSTQIDTTRSWTQDINAELSVSQSAFKDWEGGNSGVLSLTASISGTAQRTSRLRSHQYNYEVAFGFLRRQDTEGRAFRKTEDQIRVQGSVQRKETTFFDLLRPTLSGRLRTQFARGFNFSENPFPGTLPEGDEDPPVQTSEFLSPIFIAESIGLTFVSDDWYTVQLGVSSKQTAVRKKSLRVLYDLNQSQIVRVQGGIALASTVERDITENIAYNSRFNTFFGIGQRGNLPDFFWENYLEMKVNEWLSAHIEFVSIFNESTVRAVQIKEKLSIELDLEIK